MPLVVVNMIPNNRSGESNQDSEPNITVDPADPMRIAGSAFTPNLAGNPNAPIYVSTDGGLTWALASIVPSQHNVTGTGDITVRFAASGTLYAGILRRPSAQLRLNILRTPNFISGATMTVLVDRTPPAGNPDQPWVQAMTALGGSGAGLDKVYVGSNDRPGTGTGFTATIDRSLDGVGATPPPPSNLTINRLETRATTWFSPWPPQDAPPTRPAPHPDGTVYAVFCGPRSTSGSSTLVSDIVVVRDDNWAGGATPFTALTDPSDSLAGRLVRTGRNVMWSTYMGQERLGPNLAIAVDPRNSSNVYIAYTDLAGSNSTIHVLRSQDRGVNWSASDLRTVTNATNVGLAVNSRGRVGLLYQQLTGSGSSQRWVTHLELTDNNWATSATEFVLATVPANTPAAMWDPYIGDYANLVSLGKDFYGIFSANNTPNNANFPNGVTYQRNATFDTHTLLANDGTTVVPASIDPFFVKFTEVARDHDFYVRDWTDSPTSGDNGMEPSSHPVFYLTSDVWNRRKNQPGAFNANDQPTNEYPKMGPGNSGRNFGFARIRRNASGSAVTVSAHFLVSPFGVGSPYQNADVNPDVTVSFGGADLVKTTPGYEWHIGSTMTDHLCFAVEITAPGDPIAPPSLLGHTPGWPTTDLMVLNDNNKAQRNMYPPPTAGSGASCFYALVRNGATFRRDLVLDYRAADPRVEKQLGRIAISPIGQRGVKRASSGRLVLEGMEPGERRWISVTVEAKTGTGRTPLPILFEEVVGNTVVNGFAIAPVPSPLGTAIASNLELHQFRFARLAAAFDVAEGRRQSAGARKLLGTKRVTGAMYLRFLREHLEGMKESTGELTSRADSDPFGLKGALSRLEKALAAESADEAAPGHLCFLGGLDAFQTMLQLEAGDPASVLHNVEWERELFTEVEALARLEGAKAVVKASDKFAQDFDAGKAGPDDFPGFVRRVLPALREAADALPKVPLSRALDTLERSLGSAAEAQGAHRDVLLRLARLR